MMASKYFDETLFSAWKNDIFYRAMFPFRQYLLCMCECVCVRMSEWACVREYAVKQIKNRSRGIGRDGESQTVKPDRD